MALDADAPSGPQRAGGDPRPRAGRRSRGCAGCRRRLRRQAAGRRGGPRRLARPPTRAPGALGGDAEREHDRDAPRPWRGARVHDRGHPRRTGGGLSAAKPAGHRRLSAHRGDPAGLHRVDGERRVRDPEDRDGVHERRHQHDADRAVPRRRPPGGDAGDRTCDGPVRAGGGARSRRGAPAQPVRLRRLPADDGIGRDLRLRRLRAGARPRARGVRLRGAARGAAAAARGGRHARAGHRRQRVRRDHERPRRVRARRCRDHAGGRGDPPHRIVLPRSGPRDDVRDDRRGQARPTARVGACHQGRHRRGASGHRHLRLEVHPDRRCRGAGGSAPGGGTGP